MEIAVLGIDLGKTVCSVAGVDGTGAVVMRKRVQRFRLLDFWRSCHLVWSPWKPVAAPITLGGFVCSSVTSHA
ncbi:MAG: hypothetical protein ABIR04_03705 [Cypionkella sp.]